MVTLCCALSFSLFAQTVKQYPTWKDLPTKEPNFYLANPSKILPDAKTAFQKGNYSRSIMLCDMHWIAFGDDTSDIEERNSLDTKAKKCYDMSEEIKALIADGKIPEAKQLSRELLTINPQDYSALDVLMLADPAPIDTMAVTESSDSAPVVVTDVLISSESISLKIGETGFLSASVLPLDASDKSVVWTSDNPSVATVDQSGIVKAIAPGTAIIVVMSNDGNKMGSCTVMVNPELDVVESVVPEKEPDKRIPSFSLVVKAGVGVRLGWSGAGTPIDLDFAVGTYKLGGSHWGGEIGGFVGLGSKIFGVDAQAVYSLSKLLSLRAGLGTFFCTYSASTTRGMDVLAGMVFMIGDHFCVDVGAAFFPTIQVLGQETINTAGTTYQMPVVVTVMKAGVVPSIKLGWAF